DARAPEWLHCQRSVGCRTHRQLAHGCVHRIEICVGGTQRVIGAGGEAVQRASGDCRAGDHRHGDGQARRVGAHPLTLPSGTPLRRDVFRSLKNPVPPSVVGEKVLEIVESGTWQLRHPVGPDAMPFLQWRKAMSDEEWVAWGALGDDAWYDRLKADFGMDARPNA